MTSAAADKKRSYSCCFFCIVSPLSIPIAFTLLFFWMIHNRNTAFIIYENLPDSKVFAGGKNESYCYIYYETYIEADLSSDSFNEYAKKSQEPFFRLDLKALMYFATDLRISPYLK